MAGPLLHQLPNIAESGLHTVESGPAKHHLRVNHTVGRLPHQRGRVQLAEFLPHEIDLLVADQIGLGDNDGIRSHQLFDRFGVVFQVELAVGRVQTAHHVVHIVAVGEHGVHQNRKQNGGRVSQACRFNDHAVQGDVPPFGLV